MKGEPITGLHTRFAVNERSHYNLVPSHVFNLFVFRTPYSSV